MERRRRDWLPPSPFLAVGEYQPVHERQLTFVTGRTLRPEGYSSALEGVKIP